MPENKNNEKEIVHFGKGIKIKGLQFKVIVGADQKHLAKKLKGKPKPLLFYGKPSGYFEITRERGLDINLERGKSIPVSKQLDIYKATKDLYKAYEHTHEPTKNAFFQYHLEDEDGHEFHINLGTTKSDHLPYLQEDNWHEIGTLQLWVNEEKEDEY
jgi:hypothetical protein